MYNLFISGSDEDFEGTPFEIDQSRAFEHTNGELKSSYEALTANQVNELKKHPCIFAYETGSEKPPKYGMLKGVKKRQKMLLIEYEIISLTRFLTVYCKHN
ncbi:hypothetical protein B0I27_105185 [Arcticibacter pallidicorallinus]|uniref:Uncharacterized protein n=1 Tax=Arcticibacter pallidicorallinus TaxID=1259464 RepID=A0A2T0U472_9SPHI|nr:hypothetical protein B0I27_105185 [Arcticibacter pallidicorallinus]